MLKGARVWAVKLTARIGAWRSPLLLPMIWTQRDTMRPIQTAHVYCHKELFTKLKKHGRVNLFKEHKDQPDEEITLEHVCNRLIIWGTPGKVTDELLAFRDVTGDFGKLLYAGMDWAGPELAQRSMIFTAEKVQPAINSAEANKTRAAQ